MGNNERYDFVVVGGGIFGVYAALYLENNGAKVCIIEKESALFQKASVVNQARLHSGYHYPRSVATAVMSNDNKERFTADHREFIHFAFDQYYAIDKYGSFTGATQFERFCAHLGIRCDLIERHPLFNADRIEALFLTTEYSFDPFLIAHYYRQKLENRPGIEVYYHTKITSAVESGDHWEISLTHLNTGAAFELKATQVINATYAGSNAVNRIFGVEDIHLMHEISEMAFVTSPQAANTGLTIMDGPFASLMPYGRSGLLSLSSVAYTHHKVSYDNLPTFDCQESNKDCQPDFPSICNYCHAKPVSNYKKMLSQISQYFTKEVEFQYFTSFFTIKSKLKASHIDDGRPTEIAVLKENPRFYCIFAGKINSIYEIEKVISF